MMVSSKTVLLLTPPGNMYIRDDRCQSNVDEFAIAISRPPLELMIMGTVLQQAGHTVELRDYAIAHKPIAAFQNDLSTIQVDVVCVNATLPSLATDLLCLQKTKEFDANILCVVRCGMIKMQAHHIMQRYPCIDIVIYGESDVTLRDLFESPDRESVPGIFYRKGQEVVMTSERPVLEDLDRLPTINRELIDSSLYVRPDTNKPLGLIEVSRGCPFSCSYCLTPLTYGRRHRSRSVDRVINEIRECVERYAIYDFHFKSDLFTADKQWVRSLCERLIAEQFTIRWFANSRADCFDYDLLQLMKESGCFALSIGVESGSEETLQKIEKRTTLQTIRDAFQTCREVGVQTYAYFIIGFPWETEEMIEETLAFSRELNPDYVDFFFPYIFDGTPLAVQVKESLSKTTIAGDAQAYAGVQFATKYVDENRLIRLRKKALWQFYMRPAYALKVLRRYPSVRDKGRLLWQGIKLCKKIVRG